MDDSNTVENAKNYTHWCTCNKFCEGGRFVPRTTHYRHKKQCAQEQAALRAQILQRFGSPTRLSTSSSSLRTKRKRQTRAVATPDPTDFRHIPRPPTPPQEPDGMDLGPPMPNSGDDLNPLQGLQSPDVLDDEFDEPDDGNPPPPSVNLSQPMPRATLSKLKLSQNMIDNIRNASIEDDIRDESVLDMLKTPPSEDISLDAITEVSMGYRIFFILKSTLTLL
ncbi:hypothetical protein M378DRAFT_179965 [Amanita muscaria Koide BX008]|uniref:Uncharacterized protein n=1 Tax=Amanita muscaria (strain Koide BX008) TaxID=946122 RepID=A0A0C2WJK4_AMAMK|nr:hypothetical protein M378DRAFT_179965 [Amanita muscaria Koide BX008]